MNILKRTGCAAGLLIAILAFVGCGKTEPGKSEKSEHAAHGKAAHEKVAKAPEEEAPEVKEEEKAPVREAPPSKPKPAASGSGAGTVVGTVMFAGDPPGLKALDVNKDVEVCGATKLFDEKLIISESKGVRNAVVYLEGAPAGDAASGKEYVLDQKGCRYDPHVLLVPAGESVKIKNSDGILHNVHTYSEKNSPLNRAQPRFRKVITETFKAPERVKVTCDAHGWMSGWIVVQDHPYYALSDAGGKFEIQGVPAGKYQLKTWHETLGEQSAEVTVSSGEQATAAIVFSP